MRLRDKIAIVTGAARGMGAEHCRRFLAEGAKVVLTDINEDDGKRLEAELGTSSLFVRHDVGSEADWVRVVKSAEDRFGPVTVLVNNAGIIGPVAKAADLQADDFETVCRINQTSVFLGIKHVIPSMIRAGGGSIVNLSSLAAFLGTPNLSAYGASKGAVRQFTKTVAIDCARKGYKVRCNSVHPGIILTPMGEGILPNDKVKERVRGSIPIGDFGAPADIAYGILYLISDESRFVTGAELVIDGGTNAI